MTERSHTTTEPHDPAAAGTTAHSSAPEMSPGAVDAGDVDDNEIRAAHQVYERGEASTIGALVADITTDLSTLVRQEVQLAKAEVRESATHAAKSAGLMGAAGVAAHFSVLFLTVALWWALGTAMHSRAWAAVLVAALWSIVAAIFAALGRRNLKDVRGVPRTVLTAKKIPDALKGNEDSA
jgi:uncharacterized membrane protein YqjE